MLVTIRAVLLTASAVAVTACAAPAAAAATVTAGTASVTGDKITYTAAKGVVNKVVVSGSGRNLFIDDSRKVKAGKGCKAVKGDSTKVKCTTKNRAGFEAFLGDKNDVYTGKTLNGATVHGGAGNDVLVGGPTIEYVYGDAGNDRVSGGAGDYDFVFGGAGNDTVDGGKGNEDYLDGGPGADVLKGGPGGGDRVSYRDYTAPVTADIDGAKGDDGAKGEKDTIATDVEVLEGGKGDDTLTGNAKNRSWVQGNDGNDTVRGGAAADTLSGGYGNDKVYGLAGDDFLVSGYYGDFGGNEEQAGDTDTLDAGTQTTDQGDYCAVGPNTTHTGCERVATD